IHDLTLPVPSKLKAQWDMLVDVGTLEHIFDPISAVMNYRDLVRENGSLILIVPSNNQSGHGLYQFSPEFAFVIFSRENGWNLRTVMVAEDNDSAVFYECCSPERVGNRVEYQ